MILSIIIPYYNVAHYTDELLKCLAPQIREGVEVILVDDGSKVPYKTNYKWCKVVRQENKGVSAARNKGLELAQGEYITFIDADDLVSDRYIDMILAKIPFDYLDMSWKSLPGGQQFEYRLTSDSDRLKNPSAVTRAFSRAIIGDIRFNEQKQAAEDAEFTNIVCKRAQKVGVIQEFCYFYRTYTPNSLTKRYLSGDMDTKRIVYHYNHITSDMTDLLEEIKRENIRHEIYVLTEQNDIPELEQYSKVMKPCKVRGMELRGEPWQLFTRILPMPEFDIIIYTSHNHINGIFTWIYSFCGQMGNKYSIAVLHEGMDSCMVERLIKYAYVKQNGEPIKCKTLVMMRLTDSIPTNIRYVNSIQMVHANKQIAGEKTIPLDRDMVIPVSKTVKESWNLKEDPILNMTYSGEQLLHLISATRLKTQEKGVDRMKQLCYMLRQANIPFVWECYSDIPPDIRDIMHRNMVTDIRQRIRNADYLVQLSDDEAFGYSMVEALEEGTPIITTPLAVLSELGFVEGTHGYTFGFNMEGDINRLRSIPKFKYECDNGPSKKQWCNILGDQHGQRNKPITIQCIKRYRDVQLDRYIEAGEYLTLNPIRAHEITDSGYAKEV